MEKTPQPSGDAGFVVTVLFQVVPNVREALREAVRENAASSLRLEPGCQVFDVCENAASPEFFLYEVYGSEQEFRAHLETDHFRAFDQLSSSWVTSKQVLTYVRLRQAPTSVGASSQAQEMTFSKGDSHVA